VNGLGLGVGCGFEQLQSPIRGAAVPQALCFNSGVADSDRPFNNGLTNSAPFNAINAEMATPGFENGLHCVLGATTTITFAPLSGAMSGPMMTAEGILDRAAFQALSVPAKSALGMGLLSCVAQ